MLPAARRKQPQRLRRPFRRPEPVLSAAPTGCRERGAPKPPEDTGALDVNARRVLATNGGDARRLEALVRDLQQLRDEADRVAFAEPSPDALGKYRRASRELAEAQRACALAAGA